MSILKDRSNPPSRRLGLALVLLALPVLTLLGFHGFRNKLASFQPLGFGLAEQGETWRVQSIATPPPGDLLPGDRLVLVNGVETARIADLRRLLAASPTSELLVLRAERLETISYRRPAIDLDLPWLVLAGVGFLYLAIGLYTLWRSPDGLLFFAWCLASAVLFIFSPVFPVDGIGKAVFFADQLARLLVPPLTLHLFLSVPRRTRSRALLPLLLYSPALVLALAQLRFAFAAGAPSRALLQAFDRLEIFHFAAFAATAVIVLARRLRAVAQWEQHRQLLWLLVGTTAGYAPFLLLYGFPFLAGIRLREPLAALSTLPLAAVPIAFAWAVLRFRLWDLGLMVRKGLAHALTLIAAVGGFSLVDFALRRLLPDEVAFTRDLLTFFGGIAIIGLVVPAHRRIHGALEQLQYGQAFRRRRGLVWLGHDLLHERDLDRLCEALLLELEQGLDLERANLLLVQGSRLVAVRPERSLPDSLDLDGIAPPIWGGRFDLLRNSGPAGAASPDLGLFAAGYRYVFPLVVRENRIGLVLTGLRGDDEPLDSEDVDLVRGLLDQAALAIENAQLLDQVQRQLETVVALKRHSEGILESSPAGIAELDAGNVVATANLAFAALAGRPRSEIVGSRLDSVLDLGELPKPGGGIVQVACRDAFGRERQLEVSLAPLQSEEGSDRRVLVLQDVTARVAMEGALKQKDRLAALGILAAGVAHEVNTPLTGISSYAQLLLAETDASDPRRELLEKVEKQTFRAARIVSNLLEFARTPGVERREIDVVALFSDSIDLLRQRLSSKQIRLVWQRPDATISVLGSEGELQQVFTNLIVNAVDAVAEVEEATLTLTLEAGADRVRISVADSGPGVPAENSDAIFQPFFTTKRGQGGTGLGLSISHSIVENHGGCLVFENLSPRGCRFTVDLPRLSSPAVAE